MKSSKKKEKILKEKIQLEYEIRASPKILFNRLGTPGGLSEWFCDDVNIRGAIYSFRWDNNDQQAKLLSKKEEKYIRFQWLEEPEDTYFEFKIEIDDLTGDVALVVTDFCDKDEKKEATKLWNSQIDELRRVLGSF
jgi:uncharacterized protein YndB with AHSA1/START domain